MQNILSKVLTVLVKTISNGSFQKVLILEASFGILSTYAGHNRVSWKKSSDRCILNQFDPNLAQSSFFVHLIIVLNSSQDINVVSRRQSKGRIGVRKTDTPSTYSRRRYAGFEWFRFHFYWLQRPLQIATCCVLIKVSYRFTSSKKTEFLSGFGVGAEGSGVDKNQSGQGRPRTPDIGETSIQILAQSVW